MRFLVLFLGFVGFLLTAGAGAAYFEEPAVRAFVGEFKISELNTALSYVVDPTDKNYIRTGMFLLIAAGFGFLGTLLAFLRCGWQGSLLMLTPVVCTAVLSPVTLVSTSLQAFAALISMFVGPLPINKSDNDDED